MSHVPCPTSPGGTMFAVVVNHEEQYSVWPTDQEIPAGWREEGTRGSREECVARIGEVWTDLRPLSARA
ncbi:MbtH family NRPS accessory protein [Streptomyces sp. NPDC006638]|uniref:MbtH family protein n=1 Tax=Streptomyces sp. NPDC006638 TaxID=3157183 RepID=UPI0033B8AAAD